MAFANLDVPRVILIGPHDLLAVDPECELSSRIDAQAVVFGKPRLEKAFPADPEILGRRVLRPGLVDTEPESFVDASERWLTAEVQLPCTYMLGAWEQLSRDLRKVEHAGARGGIALTKNSPANGTSASIARLMSGS